MRFALKRITGLMLSLGFALMISACGSEQTPPPPPPPAPAQLPAQPDPNQPPMQPGGPGPGPGYNDPCGPGYQIEIWYEYEYCVPRRRWNRHSSNTNFQMNWAGYYGSGDIEYYGARRQRAAN